MLAGVQAMKRDGKAKTDGGGLVAEARKARKAEARAREREQARRAADPSGGKVVPGTRTVPDPYEAGAVIAARVNLAEHPLELMLARRRLDAAQYEAGTRFRAIYERAMIGVGRAIDYSRVRVDGGKAVETLSDDCASAHLELARLARQLGPVGYSIMQTVAGQGEPVSRLSERWPGDEARRAKMDYLTMRLREALDLLSTDVWGARGPQRGKLRVMRMEG